MNGGRLLYLAGQVANNPDGTVAGVGDWRHQAEKVYENIGHILRAAGATPAQAVKETTWVLDIASWRQHGSSGTPYLLPGRLPCLHARRDSGSGTTRISRGN